MHKHTRTALAAAAALATLTPTLAHAANTNTGPTREIRYGRGHCDYQKQQLIRGKWHTIADFNADRRHPNRLTADQMAAILHHTGWTRTKMRNAAAIASGESDWCQAATHTNRDSRGRVLSTDYGLWQINDKWHPVIKRGDVFNAYRGATIAKQISRNGANWKLWGASKYAFNPKYWCLNDGNNVVKAATRHGW